MTVQKIPDLSRLRRRLAAVLAAAAVVLWAAGAFYYAHHRASLRASAESLLLSTEQIKLDQLLRWREERLSDAMLLAESPLFSSYANRLGAGAGMEAAALVRKRMESFLRHKNYPFAAVADRSGRVLAYAGDKAESGCPQFKRLFPAALAAGRAQMGEFSLAGGDPYPHIDIAVPVSGGAGLLFLVRVNPDDYLYPLLQAWSAKGDTGEILLVTRDAGDVLFLNDLRHARNAAMRLRLPASSPDLPAAIGLRGHRGVVLGRDYRGMKVLAAVSPVEGTNWALVTKLDWSEVMAGSVTVGVLLALLLFSMLGAGAAWAFLLFKRQAEAYERSYRQMSANYRLLNEKASDCIFVVDLETCSVLEANRAACETYGYSAGEMKGLPFEALIPDGGMDDFSGRVREAMAAGSRAYEVQHRRKNGELFPAELSDSVTEVDGRKLMFVIARDVGWRRRAEAAQLADREKLARLNERLTLAARAGRLGVWDWDVKSDVLTWDDRMYELYGVRKGDFKGAYEAWKKTVHPDDKDRCERELQAALRGEPQYESEFRVVLPGGEVRHIKANGDIFRGADGQPLRMVGVNQDITARRRAEEDAVSLSQQRQLALNAARLGWWRYDPASRMAYYDERYKEIFEVGGESRPNEEILKRLHPEDLPGVWASVEAALDPEKRSLYDAEYRIVMPDGRVKFVEAHGQATFSGAGAAARALELVGTVQDITERKAAEEALRESERAVRRKLDAILSPDMDVSRLELSDIIDGARIQKLMDRFYAVTKIGIGIIDLKGKVLVGTGWQEICTRFHRANPVTCRLCKESDLELSSGVPAGETKLYQCKNGMWDMVTPIMLGDVHVGNIFLGQFLFEGEEPDLEVFREQARRYGFDEEEYLAALKAVPRWSRPTVDAAMAFYASFADVIGQLSLSNVKLANTLEERNRAQRALEKAAKALREKNLEMENFLYITTHDLRSPLVNIQGFSQNIARYVKRLQEELAVAQAAPEVRDLSSKKIPEALDFVLGSARRMDALITALLKVSRAGRVEMRPEALDAGALLGKVLDAMRFQLEQAGAEVSAGPLPPCRADAGALSQVFGNLLDNAVKYRAEGRRLKVEITGEANGGAAVYRIADNGPGIPEKDLDRIWNVFYSQQRADPRKGEGIGLPMVKRLVEKNGGAIKAESREGQGTVFTVELPGTGGVK